MIASLTGTLLIIVAMMMGISLFWSFYYGDDWLALAMSAIITGAGGFMLRLFNYNNSNKEVRKRDGFLIVALGWIAMSLFGSLPYIIGGAIPNLVDAFFETMSGITTTGATILTDVEALPNDLLFWRSMTHWIGGMGIIVLTVAILPLLGVGGIRLLSLLGYTQTLN